MKIKEMITKKSKYYQYMQAHAVSLGMCCHQPPLAAGKMAVIVSTYSFFWHEKHCGCGYLQL
jgi:hypothetical protein